MNKYAAIDNAGTPDENLLSYMAENKFGGDTEKASTWLRKAKSSGRLASEILKHNIPMAVAKPAMAIDNLMSPESIRKAAAYMATLPSSIKAMNAERAKARKEGREVKPSFISDRLREKASNDSSFATKLLRSHQIGQAVDAVVAPFDNVPLSTMSESDRNAMKTAVSKEMSAIMADPDRDMSEFNPSKVLKPYVDHIADILPGDTADQISKSIVRNSGGHQVEGGTKRATTLFSLFSPYGDVAAGAADIANEAEHDLWSTDAPLMRVGAEIAEAPTASKLMSSTLGKVVDAIRPANAAKNAADAAKGAAVLKNVPGFTKESTEFLTAFAKTAPGKKIIDLAAKSPALAAKAAKIAAPFAKMTKGLPILSSVLSFKGAVAPSRDIMIAMDEMEGGKNLNVYEAQDQGDTHSGNRSGGQTALEMMQGGFEGESSTAFARKSGDNYLDLKMAQLGAPEDQRNWHDTNNIMWQDNAIRQIIPGADPRNMYADTDGNLRLGTYEDIFSGAKGSSLVDRYKFSADKKKAIDMAVANGLVPFVEPVSDKLDYNKQGEYTGDIKYLAPRSDGKAYPVNPSQYIRAKALTKDKYREAGLISHQDGSVTLTNKSPDYIALREKGIDNPNLVLRQMFGQDITKNEVAMAAAVKNLQELTDAGATIEEAIKLNEYSGVSDKIQELTDLPAKELHAFREGGDWKDVHQAGRHNKGFLNWARGMVPFTEGFTSMENPSTQNTEFKQGVVDIRHATARKAFLADMARRKAMLANSKIEPKIAPKIEPKDTPSPQPPSGYASEFIDKLKGMSNTDKALVGTAGLAGLGLAGYGMYKAFSDDDDEKLKQNPYMDNPYA